MIFFFKKNQSVNLIKKISKVQTFFNIDLKTIDQSTKYNGIEK